MTLRERERVRSLTFLIVACAAAVVGSRYPSHCRRTLETAQKRARERDSKEKQQSVHKQARKKEERERGSGRQINESWLGKKERETEEEDCS